MPTVDAFAIQQIQKNSFSSNLATLGNVLCNLATLGNVLCTFWVLRFDFAPFSHGNVRRNY